MHSMITTSRLWRPAIAMIELIFAIVVMGIVMMSVPQLLSTASQSGYVALQQEAINEASAQMNIIMGHYWDENNITGSETPILLTTNGDADLNRTRSLGGVTYRMGTPLSSFRSFLSASGKTYSASAIGSDGGDRDDIDDFDGDSNTLLLEDTTSTSDYIDKQVKLASAVNYARDGVMKGTYLNPDDAGASPSADHDLTFDFNTTALPVGQTSNIKHIQVTLTTDTTASELNKTIVLHAFSCNIGSYKLEER